MGRKRVACGHNLENDEIIRLATALHIAPMVGEITTALTVQRVGSGGRQNLY
jgi:hypothetical protein